MNLGLMHSSYLAIFRIAQGEKDTKFVLVVVGSKYVITLVSCSCVNRDCEISAVRVRLDFA